MFTVTLTLEIHLSYHEIQCSGGNVYPSLFTTVRLQILLNVHAPRSTRKDFPGKVTRQL